jgi:kumamolisin
MNQSHIELRGTKRVPLPGARVVGAVSADEWIEVTVKLRRKAALPELEGRPKEPMTYEQLTKAYGCTQDDVDKVAAALHEYGLEVVESDPKTRSVKVAGPSSAMEKAFLVKLVRYTHERGNYRGRVGALHIPSKLGGLVEGVFGLDNRRITKRRSATAPRLQALSAATTAKSHPWFFPAELAKIYRFPQGDGSGQSIGLLEFGGGYFPSDLAAFCKAAKVSVPNVIPISVDHAPTDQHDGAEGEVMLDVEVVAGACPKATIPVYFSQFTEKGWVDALDAAIHDQENKPTVISISWGNAEDNAIWTDQAIVQVNEALKEAALLGITVCVAAGDDGSDDQVGDGHAHADFPCASPYVLGVGGTTLRKHGQTYDETVWKDGNGLRDSGGGSTGGGVSSVFDRPTWQNVDIANVNPGAKDGRVTPDVAADASGNTGYMTVVDGKASVSGGTSASAPLWAALIARINENLPQGKRVGYLTPVLYQASGNSTVGALGCRDIVSGNNNTAAVGGYSAGPGYDAVSGWGTPLGDTLLQEIKKIV